MKKTLLGAVLCAALCFSAHAQEPQPAARRSHVSRFTRYVRDNFLGVFTDLKDKQWATAFTLDTLAQAADTASTCYGQSHGFVEAGVPAGSHSCTRTALTQFGLHFTKWTADHAAWKEWVQKCREEKQSSQVNGPAWLARAWSQSDPESCKFVMWIGDLTVPIHAMNTYSNVCLMQGGCVIKPKDQHGRP